MVHKLIWLTGLALFYGQNLSLHQLSNSFREWMRSKSILSPQLRTANLSVPDSMWHDNYQNGQWELYRLRTYGYLPGGKIVWDSAFSWNATEWEKTSAALIAYHASGPFSGEDSVRLDWSYDANTQAFSPVERRSYSYTSLGGGRRLDQILQEIWDTATNQWNTAGRERLWMRPIASQLLPDSSRQEIYDSGSWRDFIQLYYFYTSQGKEDSLFGRLNLEPFLGFPGEMLYFQKYTYDGQGRVIRVRDSIHINALPLYSGPNEVTHTFSFYPSSSALKPSRDSSYSFNYQDQQVYISRTHYTYDAQGNILVAVYDTCATSGTPCGPTERDRYHYIQVPASLANGVGRSWGLPSPLSAGSLLFLSPEMGKAYLLYDAVGRAVSQGLIGTSGATLLLPSQPGVYFLQIDNACQRLFVAP
ncbi:MAG: T9SS type A sorting domain-containing protein [Bacteroidia bacterium]|nr:T9SS type A sorting domain-containing protein [Bacteroidia bacterium]